MALRDIVRVNRKTFVNPRAWLDYDGLKAQTLMLRDVLKGLFTKVKPTKEETFQEAVKRLHLSAKDIEDGITSYRSYALLFTVLGFLVFFYSFYLLFQHVAILGFAVGMGASGLFFSQAFQYDFWALQMRRRKLGLSFDDWLQSIVGGSKKS